MPFEKPVIGIYGDDFLCRFYRIDEPMKYLSSMGKVNISTNKSNWSIVSRSSQSKQSIVRKRGAKIVYSIDDLFWKFNPGHACYKEFLSNGALNEANFWVNKASKIVTSSGFLSTWIELFKGKKSLTIENSIPDRWLTKRATTKNDLVILSLGNKSHDHDIFQTNLLREFGNIGKKGRIVSIGRSTLGIPITHDHTFSTEGYFKLLCNYSGAVGLIPLVDDPFNKAKSNIKALEFVAAGITPLFSPVGEYKKLGDLFPEFSKREDKTWEEAIEKARNSDISKLKEFVRSNYVISVVSNKWMEVFS